MKRVAVGFLGMLLGGVLGWIAAWALLPTTTFSITTVGPQDPEYAFQMLGLLIGAAVGFAIAILGAFLWIEEPATYRPIEPLPADPRKVEDNLG